MNDVSLAAIREAEMEAAVRLEAARSDADAAVVEAHRRGQRLVEQARQEGMEEASRRYAAAIAAAEREAASISADQRIEEVRSAVTPRIPRLVDAMMELILAPPAGTEG